MAAASRCAIARKLPRSRPRGDSGVSRIVTACLRRWPRPVSGRALARPLWTHGTRPCGSGRAAHIQWPRAGRSAVRFRGIIGRPSRPRRVRRTCSCLGHRSCSCLGRAARRWRGIVGRHAQARLGCVCSASVGRSRILIPSRAATVQQGHRGPELSDHLPCGRWHLAAGDRSGFLPALSQQPGSGLVDQQRIVGRRARMVPLRP